jgi:hypothetical protein
MHPGNFILLASIYLMLSIPSMLLMWGIEKWLSTFKARGGILLIIYVVFFVFLFIPGMLPTDFFYVPAPLIIVLPTTSDIGFYDLVKFQGQYIDLLLWGGFAVVCIGFFVGRRRLK